MANSKLLKLLKSGTSVWNKWRLENRNTTIDLSNADLSGSDLSGINFSNANLSSANLNGANLKGANLQDANLRHANLESANLSKANLTGVKLEGANTNHTIFADANSNKVSIEKLKQAVNKPKKATAPSTKTRLGRNPESGFGINKQIKKPAPPLSVSRPPMIVLPPTTNNGEHTPYKAAAKKFTPPKKAMAKKADAGPRRPTASPKKAPAKKVVPKKTVTKNSVKQSLKDSKAVPPKLDVVTCAVFAPPVSAAGKTIMVQAFAHLPEEKDIVKELATQFDDSAELRASKQLDNEVSRGSELVFCLSMKGIEMDEPTQKLVWRGQAESVQFEVTIPANYPDDNIIGTVYVSRNSVPFGQLKFLIKVQSAANNKDSSQPKDEEGSWKRYKYAFISYASTDRKEVLKRVQMLSGAGLEFFQDLLTLKPGEIWKNELYKNIDKCDVFFLFWSNAAKKSTWVMKEVDYALQIKGGKLTGNPEIIPVIIEGPPLVSPPPELQEIQFNDKFIYFINAF